MIQRNLKQVVMVGRPNVGKSSLFNRLIGRRVAIESDIPGTTRDRLYNEVTWQGFTFALVDAAGVLNKQDNFLEAQIQESVNVAIENSDLILFVVDATDSQNDQDKTIARIIRKNGAPAILVVNKVDNAAREKEADIFRRLGNFQAVVGVSAVSGRNTGDLLDEIVNNLGQADSEDEREDDVDENKIFMSILGRPNVGKSTLLNAILGRKQAVVSDVPGTTRDTISVEISHKGKDITIIDTAGIRRPGKIGKHTLESYSVIRSYKAMMASDVVVLLISAEEGVTNVDEALIGEAKDSGKGIVLAVNKIDLVEDKEDFQDRLVAKLQTQLNFIPWLPIVFLSAKTEENVNHLLNQIIKIDENRRSVLDPGLLGEILVASKDRNPQLGKIVEIAQIGQNPPKIEVVYQSKEAPHYTQIRYLENKIRDIIPLNGVPIELELRKLNPGRKI